MDLFEYQLLDFGRNWRIEKFADLTVQRPCPVAFKETVELNQPDLVYKNANWNQETIWQIQIDHITAELRTSKGGQVGLFPEQYNNWQWLYQQVKKSDRPLNILNTFAYTGMSTLFSSTEKTTVCHVDGAKSAINWAKRNAELSGLSDHKIRWICDDVIDFMKREVRRGNKYDAIILDPPAFGRGKNKVWKIKDQMPELLSLMNQLLSDNPAFIVLTCHAPDLYTAGDFAEMLEDLKSFKGQTAQPLYLDLETKDNEFLESSFGARICYL